MRANHVNRDFNVYLFCHTMRRIVKIHKYCMRENKTGTHCQQSMATRHDRKMASRALPVPCCRKRSYNDNHRTNPKHWPAEHGRAKKIERYAWIAHGIIRIRMHCAASRRALPCNPIGQDIICKQAGHYGQQSMAMLKFPVSKALPHAPEHPHIWQHDRWWQAEHCQAC